MKPVENRSVKPMKFNFAVALIHGDIDQNERTKVIASFKRKEYPILVATDVAGKFTLLQVFKFPGDLQ